MDRLKHTTRQAPGSARRSARPAYWGGSPGFLYQHRAFVRFMGRGKSLGGSLLLTATFTAAALGTLRWLTPFWGHVLAFWNEALGAPARVVMTLHQWPAFTLALPHLDLPAAAPSPIAWTVTAVVTALVILASFLVPERMTPLIYFLRAIAFLQATALVFFAVWPDHFPYTLASYLEGMMQVGLALYLLIPLVFGLTLYVHDLYLWQKVAVTLVAMGHLAVLLPLQYAVHAYLIHAGSLLFMPALYLLFGIPVDVLVVIAVYAWGMSWEGKVLHHSPPYRARASAPATSETQAASTLRAA